jgi:hypothetical protein
MAIGNVSGARTRSGTRSIWVADRGWLVAWGENLEIWKSPRLGNEMRLSISWRTGANDV